MRVPCRHTLSVPPLDDHKRVYGTTERHNERYDCSGRELPFGAGCKCHGFRIPGSDDNVVGQMNVTKGLEAMDGG